MIPVPAPLIVKAELSRMAAILRKMLERASDRPSLSPRSSTLDRLSKRASTALGVFEGIPEDVLMHILKILGPEGAMKMALVSKTWRPLIFNDRLWNFFLQNQAKPWKSLLFAEAHLRLGYPLQTSSVEVTRLSFMRIYSQRKQTPASIIIDAGFGYCKFGWSTYDYPTGRSLAFTDFDDITYPTLYTLPHFFNPIYSRMRAYPDLQPIVLTIPLCHYYNTESAKASRRQFKETIFPFLLFEMNVPAVCAVNQATLALYAARQTSGIVVDIGNGRTSVVPILNGKVMCAVGVEVVETGGSIGFWMKLLERNGISVESDKTADTLKEKLCYVAADYDAELLKKDTKASYTVHGEGQFTLSKERFQLGEALFQPMRIARRNVKGLHQVVALCMDRCHASKLTPEEKDSWFKTVVLCGGTTACLPGLADRLERELRKHLSPSISDGIRVIPPPYGLDTAWAGAKLISNLSTFQESWCVTKKQFQAKVEERRGG